jgi:integrase
MTGCSTGGGDGLRPSGLPWRKWSRCWDCIATGLVGKHYVGAQPNRYIFVQRNYVHGRFTTPKSKKSRRVDMSRELRRVLLELRDKRMLEAFMKGKTSIAEDLVFPSRVGTVLDHSNLTHYQFLHLLGACWSASIPIS